MVPSGLDREKLFLQMERLEERILKLKEIREKLQENPEDSLLVPAAERLLQTAIEACINIGNHVISGLGLKIADTYREVFSNLYDAEILSNETSQKLLDLVSFRNRLVHMYWEVEKEEVFAKLNEIEIAEKFATEIHRYLKTKNLL